MSHVYHTTLSSGGRIVIPAALRQALRLKDGDSVVLERDGDVRCSLPSVSQNGCRLTGARAWESLTGSSK